MRKNILILIVFIGIAGIGYVTFTRIAPRAGRVNTTKTISPQFDFEAMRSGNSVIVKEFEPHKYQLLFIGKNCDRVSGGPRVFSDTLDLGLFVNKAISVDDYDTSIANDELRVTVKKAGIDPWFYSPSRDWSSPQCKFMLERAGLPR